MKKIALFISAALAVSSCVQPEPETADVPITAHTAPQTRTSMGEGVDGMHDVLWTTGDVISVSDGYLEGIYVTHQGGSSSAIFSPKTKTNINFSTGVIAGYPAGSIFLGTPDLNEDIYITIPQVQKYTKDSFAEATMPMVSDVAYEPVLNFHNAAGVIRLALSGDEEVSVSSITFTTDQQFSGDFCYNPGEQIYKEDSAASGSESITIECEEAVNVGKEAVAFNVVVPHKTYSKLNISVKATDGRVHTINMKEGKQITVQRSGIVNIPLHFGTFGTSTAPEIKMSTTYVTFTNIGISVEMKNVTSYYSGFEERESFDRELSSGNLLKDLEWKKLYTGPTSYKGSATSFQEEFGDVLIEPGHEYAFWIVPYSEDQSYTEADVHYIYIQTKAFTPGGTVTLSSDNIEVDMTSISLTLTASENIEIIYNMLFSNEDMQQFAQEQDIIDFLLSGRAYFIEDESDIVVRKFLSPGTDYTLVALAVDRKGKYGSLFRQEFTTVAIPYNDMAVEIDQNPDALKSDQTLRWSVSGGGDVAEYRYIFTETDRHLWTGTLESSVKKAGETMYLDPGIYYISKTTDTYANVSMENGKEYMFVILAVDTDGRPSPVSHWKFVY